MTSAKDVLAAYEDRINRHDFDLLTDLIAPDATFWFSDGTYRGIDAVARRIAAAHAALVERTSALASEVQRLEHAARDLDARLAARQGDLQRTVTRRGDLEANVAAATSRLDERIRVKVQHPHFISTVGVDLDLEGIQRGHAEEFS